MAGLIVAGLVSLFWCWAALWIGPRTGYVDRPGTDSLKVHERVAIPLGGVGVFLGFHLASAVEDRLDPAMLIATSLVLVLGLIDDRWGLPPLVRLFFEMVAGVVLVAGIQGDTTPGLALVLGVGLVVFAINAVNLFDGLDGLAGSVGLAAAVGVAILSSLRGAFPDEALILAAALAGFLVLGWSPARVFLGDAGAYVIGVVLAGSILRASNGDGSHLVVASGLLGVFALDLLVTVVRRLRGGRPLFEGDRSHIYDQLRDRGHSVPQVVGVAVAAQAVLSLLVISVDSSLPGAAAVLVLLAVAIGVVAALIGAGYLRVESSSRPRNG